MTDDEPSRVTPRSRTAEQKEAAKSALRRLAPGRVARAMAMEDQAVPEEARTARMRQAHSDARAELAGRAGVMGESEEGQAGAMEPVGRLYSRRAFTYTGTADVRPVGRGIRLLDVLSDDGVPNPDLAEFLESGYWDVKIERWTGGAAPQTKGMGKPWSRS